MIDQAGPIDLLSPGRYDRSIQINMQNKRNAEHILIDLVKFTWSAKVDLIWIDQSLIVDRSIPCPGKYSKSISWLYIRFDSHLIWTDQTRFQIFKLDFFGMKPIISHLLYEQRGENQSSKFINPNSLNFTLIWTILQYNPYDFVSFLRIYHSFIRSAKVWNSISTSRVWKYKGKRWIFFEFVRMFRLQSCVKVMIRDNFAHSPCLESKF